MFGYSENVYPVASHIKSAKFLKRFLQHKHTYCKVSEKVLPVITQTVLGLLKNVILWKQHTTFYVPEKVPPVGTDPNDQSS